MRARTPTTPPSPTMPPTSADSVAETVKHVKELLHDQKHFSARWLRGAHERSGLDVEHIAVGVFALLLGYAATGENARFVVNAILTLGAILVAHVYSRERPPKMQLLVYWATLALTTLFDGAFEDVIPVYWVLKLLSFCTLFLRPYEYAKHAADILQMLESVQLAAHEFDAERIHEAEKAAGSRRSPPPEKPEHDDLKQMGGRVGGERPPSTAPRRGRLQSGSQRSSGGGNSGGGSLPGSAETTHENATISITSDESGVASRKGSNRGGGEQSARGGGERSARGGGGRP